MCIIWYVLERLSELCEVEQKQPAEHGETLETICIRDRTAHDQRTASTKPPHTLTTTQPQTSLIRILSSQSSNGIQGGSDGATAHLASTS